MLSIQALATVGIFIAAFLHAIWNFILKDASDKAVGIAIIYFTSLPFAVAGAAVASGEEVLVHAELAEIDRKRLVFNVRVTHGDVLVSEGTHQRFVVG